VIPGSFAYHRPTSIDDAVALLTQLGEDALAIAGGHSLIPMMKLRLATPDHLVDLAGVAELKGMSRRRRRRHRGHDHAARGRRL
jgi:carbon-monoxide dehydrogenase medium subunit